MAKYNITEKKVKPANYRKQVNANLIKELKKGIMDVIVVQGKYKDKDYSAQKLAIELDTNTRYISAAVSLSFNMNYTSFVNKFRIEDAMGLLINSRYANLNMEEISSMVGFANRQSFYAAFYRITGTTPREFRTKHMTESNKLPKDFAKQLEEQDK